MRRFSLRGHRSGKLPACPPQAGRLWPLCLAAMLLAAPAAAADPPLEAIQQRVVAAFQKVSLAIVRIAWQDNGRQTSCSGVMVTAQGHVVTRAQHDLPPQTSVVVHLADGRRTKGVVLGTCLGWDLGMMKIVEPGPWPHAPIGKSGEVSAGELCVALAYSPIEASSDLAQHDPEPLLRIGCVAGVAAPRWLATTCRLAVGEAGGGLFDLEGRLIGVHAGGWRGYAVHAASELVQEYWDELAAGKQVERLPPPPFQKPARPAPKPAEPKPQAPVPEDQAAAALKKARPATIWFRPGCSGVIVDPDGYVATCAHHEILPGEDVKVFLPDGRVVAGKVLGSNPVGDVGLVRILPRDRWPHVELGASVGMKPGDPCVLLGFPAGSRLRYGKPWGRATRLVEPPPEFRIHRASRLFTPGPLFPGDSGGGVFDLEGRLVGIHQGGTLEEDKDKKLDWHMRIELLRRDWDFLVAGKPKEVLPYAGLGEISKAFRRAAAALPACAVEVRGDQKRRALGTVVASDGWVLTKASVLDGKLSCRLPDGRELPATLHRLSRRHDLALLKIDAKGMAPAAWSPARELPVGSLVAALRPREGPAAGVVSQAPHAVAREPGCLPLVGLRDAEGGVEVLDVPKALRPQIPILPGDIIVHLEDQPTPNAKAIAQWIEKANAGTDGPFAGDPIRVGLRRAERALEVRFPLPSASWTGPDQSDRRSGFARVFDTDVALAPDTCGGPLIDAVGQVVGIAIACKSRGRVYAIPGDAARKVADELSGADDPPDRQLR